MVVGKRVYALLIFFRQNKNRRVSVGLCSRVCSQQQACLTYSGVNQQLPPSV